MKHLSYILYVVCLVAYISTGTYAASSGTYQSTYYSDFFDGKKTSNGDIYQPYIYSAAMCSEVLGGLAEVRTDTSAVVVEINDRPNCKKHPYVIDLSPTAFVALSPLSVGRIPTVAYTPIRTPVPAGYAKMDIPTDTYIDAGIVLDTDISNSIFSDDTIYISGRVADTTTRYMTVCRLADTEERVSTQMLVYTTDKKFTTAYTLPDVGTYRIYAGRYCRGTYASIYVFDPDTFTPEVLDIHIPTQVQAISVSAQGQYIQDFFAGISDMTHTYSTVHIDTANPKDSVHIAGVGDILSGIYTLSTQVESTISLSQYVLSTTSALDRIYRSTDISVRMYLSYLYTDVGKWKYTLKTKWNVRTLTFRVPRNIPLDATYYISRNDNGSSIITLHTFDPRYTLSGSVHSTLRPGARVSIDIAGTGTYMVEVLQSDGIPYIHTYVSTLPVLPILVYSGTADSAGQVRSLNTLRKNVGTLALIYSPELEKIAKYKAEDMANDDYVWHTDSLGLDIRGTAARAGIPTTGSIGENVAAGTESLDRIYTKLLSSLSHRANIENSKWKYVGTAYTIRNWKTWYVQVFGE